MSSTVAIMQPYFFPYVGYFQLINAVDRFIIYDNIKYTKKGWINRNRILQNGAPATFTLSLKAGSDSLLISEREISEHFSGKDLLNRLRGAYLRAPYYGQTIDLVDSILSFPDKNLFEFLNHSISLTLRHLGIETKVASSSSVSADHSLSGQHRVLSICEAVAARKYVNPIGGVNLYSFDAFEDRGVELKFIKSRLSPYPQRSAQFVPGLSILDVLFFVGVNGARGIVKDDFDLLTKQMLRGDS